MARRIVVAAIVAALAVVSFGSTVSAAPSYALCTDSYGYLEYHASGTCPAGTELFTGSTAYANTASYLFAENAARRTAVSIPGLSVCVNKPVRGSDPIMRLNTGGCRANEFAATL